MERVPISFLFVVSWGAAQAHVRLPPLVLWVSQLLTRVNWQPNLSPQRFPDFAEVNQIIGTGRSERLSTLLYQYTTYDLRSYP